MMFGIGTDIIEIKRIETAIKRNSKFLEKMFTEREIELFKDRNFKNETIAGSFCVKEAVSKALGTGVRGFAFKDIEVLRDSLGKPEVILGDKITNIINNKLKVHASISHNNDTAIAFVVIEEE